MNLNDCRTSGLTAAVNPPKPPMEQSVIMLDAAVDSLNNGLQELFSRLDPVLTQMPEKSAPGPCSTPPGASPVVNRLHQITQRIEFISEQLSAIRARLEV